MTLAIYPRGIVISQSALICLKTVGAGRVPPKTKAELPRKSRQGFPRRLVPLRCVLRGGLLRRAALERSCTCLPLDTRPSKRRWCVASLSGQRSPISIRCHRPRS
jgi:hypothetical protein